MNGFSYICAAFILIAWVFCYMEVKFPLQKCTWLWSELILLSTALCLIVMLIGGYNFQQAALGLMILLCGIFIISQHKKESLYAV